MATRRASQLAIGYSSEFKRQSAWDVPLDAADLDRAFPATSRNYIDMDETTEDVDDCTGQDLLFEQLLGRFARLNIDMDFDPDVFAGIAAFAYGSASAPTGGVSEVQTETITATGGERSLTVQTGANTQTTTPLAFDATPPDIQAALELLSNVGVGDIMVSGAPGSIVYTFNAALQKQDVNTIAVNTFNLTGGTSTFEVTTPGVGKTHQITRITGFTLPLMTLYVGFRGSDEQPMIFKNVVVDQFRVRSTAREKVTAQFQLIGSGDLQQTTGYTMPDCTDILPIRFGDCKMMVAGVDYIAESLGREFEYYFQNDVKPKFDGAGIDTTRAERADKRPSQYNFFVLGEPGDDTYNLAMLRSSFLTELQLGPDGRHVKCTTPQGFLKLAPTAVRFGNDPPESELALIIRPRKISGDASTPTTISAVIAATQTLLTSA